MTSSSLGSISSAASAASLDIISALMCASASGSGGCVQYFIFPVFQSWIMERAADRKSGAPPLTKMPVNKMKNYQIAWGIAKSPISGISKISFQSPKSILSCDISTDREFH
jgi:hypothetical protein